MTPIKPSNSVLAHDLLDLRQPATRLDELLSHPSSTEAHVDGLHGAVKELRTALSAFTSFIELAIIDLGYVEGEAWTMLYAEHQDEDVALVDADNVLRRLGWVGWSEGEWIAPKARQPDARVYNTAEALGVEGLTS